MEIEIKTATEIDFNRTEFVTRESFWNVYKPGCDEHLVLRNLRKSKAYISKLDLVAVFENEIIGHILSTKAKVIDEQDIAHEILCVGPLSVLPQYQNKGIGSKLLKKSIAIAKDLGYVGMILFGNPDYYHRFGFKNAQMYSISTKDGQNFEPFMALEFQNNGLSAIKGRFFEDDNFEVNPEELIEKEKDLPYKEKLVTDTQLPH